MAEARVLPVAMLLAVLLLTTVAPAHKPADRHAEPLSTTYADMREARAWDQKTNTRNTPTSTKLEGSDSKSYSLCIVGVWELTAGWTAVAQPAGGEATLLGGTGHRGLLLGSAYSKNVDVNAVVGYWPYSPIEFAGGALQSPAATTVDLAVSFSVNATLRGGTTVRFEAITRLEYNSSTACYSSPPPPPPRPSYMLSVKAWVASATGVSGSLQVSGTVSGTLAFPPNPTGPLQKSLQSGSGYSVTAPQSFPVKLDWSALAVSCSWGYTQGDGWVSRTCTSQQIYTGTYNLTVEYSFTGGTRFYFEVDAVGPRGTRTLYFSQVPSWGTITLRNIALNGEKVSVTAYANVYFDRVNYVRATLSNSTPVTAYFQYWQAPWGRVYSTTVTGTLSSNTELVAVYLLSNRVQEPLLLPGMDFQPSNGTHFIPIAPGIYAVETNATVILLDLNRTRLHAVRGIKATMRVYSPYGELAKVGSRCREVRGASQSLPVVVLDNKEYYLFSLVAPDQANVTVYLKLNDTTLFYRVISPRVEVRRIEYTEDGARIIFYAWPLWDNYNVSVVLGGRLLSSSKASSGILEVKYEKLQDVMYPVEVELRASWGGQLRALGKTIKLLVVPVALRLDFHAGERSIILSASEPLVLGENASLWQKLAMLNETYTPGWLCLRVASNGLALWKACSTYPYHLEIPYCSAGVCTLEAIYVPTATQGVIVIPWIEKLSVSS
ncbi:hypothetical protein IG193_04300 [Infirmifilum lucidum]|uniref:Uncharacterized protein n=1 Tax=Infirmifilum lucidum TaxID=2776706 RepID=A0A7L9FJ53_9CREN|nr:hypothetical protein [Infirmifilum lucidum]QOJ79681.1 hypothetical protein IG193_04300 [Infirmifilum lucidum]